MNASLKYNGYNIYGYQMDKDTMVPSSLKLNLKWIIFSDEKKACLWSDKSAHYFFDDTELNVSKNLKMSDSE